MTENEYFMDYERRALNSSLDEDHVDVDIKQSEEEDQGMYGTGDFFSERNKNHI